MGKADRVMGALERISAAKKDAILVGKSLMELKV
jgi:hypothetical protein